MTTVSIERRLTIHDCVSCGAPIALAKDHERDLRRTHRTFYCPNGHHLSFPSESDEERLRRELALSQEQANAEAQWAADLSRRLDAERKAHANTKRSRTQMSKPSRSVAKRAAGLIRREARS